MLKFDVFQETRQGARHSNQDRIGYLYTKECAMLIVCDGMGGHHRGEVAAEFVVHYLAKAFRALAQPKLKDPSTFLFKSIHAAHDALIRYAEKEGMVEVPRTTCVVSIIQDAKASWAHVGDSRLYFMRDGSVAMRTIDHSHVQTLIDSGKITEEQAAVHPERNKIYNCVGQPTPPRIDLQNGIALKQGDSLLLSTDGFWGPIPMHMVETTIARAGIGIGVPMLMDLCESITGRECDNLSVVALKWLNQESTSVTEVIAPEIKTINDEDIAFALTMVRAAILGKSAVA